MNKKNILLILLFIILSFIIYSFLQNNKNIKINEYKHQQYLNKIVSSRKSLELLIDEKENATLSIVLGLSQNNNISNAILTNHFTNINLHKISLSLKENTNFKNVWLHIISKDGISLQRSWSSKKGDNVRSKRIDVDAMIKKPKVFTTISVGKFDMTFKAMVPIYHNDKFIGILEAITHFNSIINKLSTKGIEAIIFADKSYKQKLVKPITNTFIDDYYLVNKTANQQFINLISKIGVSKYIKNLLIHTFIVEKDINKLVSYYGLEDIYGNPMGHIILLYDLNSFDNSYIHNIKLKYNIYIFISLMILSIIFILLYNADDIYHNNFKKKVIIILILIYIVTSFLSYIALEYNTNKTIKNYKLQLQTQVENNLNMLLNQNKIFAQYIFTKYINKPKIIQLIKDKQRKTLYDTLKLDYKDWQKMFHVRQVHFHTSNITSFLRMQTPTRYGDSLVDIRPSVKYVNQHHSFYEGFEDGRVFNGFRYIYPIFDTTNQKKFLGSVGISFNSYTIVDGFIKYFHKRANFLIKSDIVDKKIFKNEKNNYIKAPIPGFYFNKIVLTKLQKLNTIENLNKLSQQQLKTLAKKILQGKPFVSHFTNTHSLVVIIPIKNKITKKVVASLHITYNDTLIHNQEQNFMIIFRILLIVLLFIAILVYKEIISRYNIIQNQKETNKKLKREITKALKENTKQLQMLQQQSKMASMGEMIGAIAHQWRQPLNAISTSIQNLKYDYKDGYLEDEQFIKDFIDKNKKTIKFMSKTIDDFRNFFRIDKEKVDFPLLETTKAVVNMQSAQLTSHNIELLIDGDETIYNGLQSEYQQVILNILNNAKDALVSNNIENPKIEIMVKNNIITIKDNAKGIPLDTINRIFEPYFTTKEQGKGTGMGLYMSKMIIEDNMGGKIDVKNIEDGAIFTINLNARS